MLKPHQLIGIFSTLIENYVLIKKKSVQWIPNWSCSRLPIFFENHILSEIISVGTGEHSYWIYRRFDNKIECARTGSNRTVTDVTVHVRRTIATRAFEALQLYYHYQYRLFSFSLRLQRIIHQRMSLGDRKSVV